MHTAPPQSWRKVLPSERKCQSVSYRMPYAPGQHKAVPDEPLYTVKVHLVLSTFVQRLIEVLLLPKMMLLVFYLIFFQFFKTQILRKEINF